MVGQQQRQHVGSPGSGSSIACKTRKHIHTVTRRAVAILPARDMMMGAPTYIMELMLLRRVDLRICCSSSSLRDNIQSAAEARGLCQRDLYAQRVEQVQPRLQGSSPRTAMRRT